MDAAPFLNSIRVKVLTWPQRKAAGMAELDQNCGTGTGVLLK